MTTLIAPASLTVYRDARTLMRALTLGPLVWSDLRKQLLLDTDRTIDAVDHCLTHGWIERRTRPVRSGAEESDFVITTLGRRVQ